VRYASITKRFDNYPAALQFLTGLRFQEGSGQFDARDYQVKAKPLSFRRLSTEWLAVKASTVRPKTLGCIKNAMEHAENAFGDANIKSIQYAHIEDFMGSLNLAPKSKANTLAILKQFWSWTVSRYDILPMKAWPVLSAPQMRFRATVSIYDQELILAEVKKITATTRPRSWLAIKWLMTYISVRPGEMIDLKECHVDRKRGLLIIPALIAKERKDKVVPLLDEDRELIANFPLCFDPNTPFFRHTSGQYAGQVLGKKRLYRDWKTACTALGIEGVDLYGGTKHSTAMGLRSVATPEEIKSLTLHSTSAAFHRYFQTSGEALRELQGRRHRLVQPDNGKSFVRQRANI
jgi:integrase